jgi:hypothetical protein
VLPVPPLVEVTAPVVLFLTPAVLPVTVTVMVQLELGGIDPPLTEIVPGAVVVSVPPPQVLEVLLGTVSPEGRLSVKPTPVRVVVVFELVIVNVRTLVPLNGMVEASNDFEIEGGAITVRVAVLLVVPVPLSLELTAPVVLFKTPAVAPVTVTMNEQVPEAGIAPPVRVMVPAEADVVTVPPPQVVAVPFGTVKPAGNVSVKVTPVRPSDEFGLVSVKVKLVVVP